MPTSDRHKLAANIRNMKDNRPSACWCHLGSHNSHASRCGCEDPSQSDLRRGALHPRRTFGGTGALSHMEEKICSFKP